MNLGSETFPVYVVEDNPAVSKSLCALLSAHGFRTTAFRSAEKFLEKFDPAQKASLLLDLRLPGMSGVELQAHLKARGSRMPIVMLTAHGDVPLAVSAMKAGAVDFIEKPGTEEHILSALEIAHKILTSRPEQKIPEGELSERLRRLTSREREVVDQLLLGNTNKQIAEALGISQRTVEIHRARIRDKLEIRGLSDLIRLFR